MKKIITFIKDYTISGFIILIPVIVIAVILTDTIIKLLDATAPLTKNINMGGPLLRSIIAILAVVIILILFFFIGGLIYKTYFGKRINYWLEKKVLVKIPFYTTLKNIIRQFTTDDKTKFPVVEIDLYGNNNKILGIITEILTDGRCIVYIPQAPIMGIGQIHIIAKENYKIVDISVKELADIIAKIGLESSTIVKNK